MKKIYSLIAAMMVAMTILVSCASENTQKTTALLESIANKDYAKAEELATTLYTVKDQLTTEEACGFAAGLNGLVNALQSTDAAKAQDYCAKFLEIADAAVAKDAEGVKKFVAESKVDISAIAESYKAQAAAAKKAAEEAAQQAAEATEEETTSEEQPAENQPAEKQAE